MPSELAFTVCREIQPPDPVNLGADAQFWKDRSAETVLMVNDQVVQDTQVTITAYSITATGVLIPHRNAVHLVSVDSSGRSLYFNETIWAATNALQVNLRNADDTPFLEQATVRVSLADDQEVYAEATTDTGVAKFANVPRTTVFIQTTGSSNRMGTAGGVGFVGTLTVILSGLNSPSSVYNNDFSQGTDGWSITAAPSVQIILHQETPACLPTPLPPQPARGVRRSHRTPSRERPCPAAGAGNPTCRRSRVDRRQRRGGRHRWHAAQCMSRNFQTDPDVSAVHLRYRFVTSEVPNAYFGSKETRWRRL